MSEANIHSRKDEKSRPASQGVFMVPRTAIPFDEVEAFSEKPNKREVHLMQQVNSHYIERL